MTWEEFLEQKRVDKYSSDDYERTDIICPNCGGVVYKNVSAVYLPYPVEHRYECEKCDWYAIG